MVLAGGEERGPNDRRILCIDTSVDRVEHKRREELWIALMGGYSRCAHRLLLRTVHDFRRRLGGRVEKRAEARSSTFVRRSEPKKGVGGGLAITRTDPQPSLSPKERLAVFFSAVHIYNTERSRESTCFNFPPLTWYALVAVVVRVPLSA